MFSSFPLFRICGIPLRVHGSLLVFLPIVALSLNSGGGAAGFLAIIALALCVYALVVLHELGHCLVGLRFGVETRDITITPIGGVAKMLSMPREPRKEFLIAIAGPAVNFVLALLLLPAYLLLPDATLVQTLLVINLCLCFFNLIPGFPMDGGRILRAALATRLPYLRATQIAVRIGQVTAVLLAFIGMFVIAPPMYMLVVIAFFVFFTAQAELTMTRMRESPAAQGLEAFMKSVLGSGSGLGGQTTSSGFGGFTTSGGPASEDQRGPTEMPGTAGTDDSPGRDPSSDGSSGDRIIDVDTDGSVRRVWRK